METMVLILKEKRKNHVSGSSQVYVQNSLNSATEIGRFKNAACTFMHVVADLFTPLPERTGKSRAAPWATMGGE